MEKEGTLKAEDCDESSNAEMGPGRDTIPTLNVLSLVAMGFFWVSGGMYGNEELMNVAAPAYALPCLLIVPLIYSLPISLINSELASALPLEGGSVAWVSEALGSALGGHNAYWTWFAYAMDSSLYPRFAAAYVVKQLKLTHMHAESLLAMAIVVLVTLNKLIGLRSVAAVSLGLSVISVLPSFLLVGFGFDKIKWGTMGDTSGDPTNWSELTTWALWLYSGALSLGSVAKDVKNAGRTYLISASILYVLDVLVINFIPLLISLSIDPERADYSAGNFINIGNRVAGGEWLGILLTIGSQVSLIGLYQSGSVASDQYLGHLLHEHVLPVISPDSNQRAQVPNDVLSGKDNSSCHNWLVGSKGDAGVPPMIIIVNAMIAMPLCWLKITDTLTVSILLSSLSICLMVVSFLVLKYKRPLMPRGYSVPGKFVGAVLISAPCIALSLINLALGLTDTSYKIDKLVPVRPVAFATVVLLGILVHVIGSRMPNYQAKRESQLQYLVANQTPTYGSLS